MMEESNNRETAVHAETADENVITLTSLLHHMRSKWLWYVISVAACLLLATLYLLHATPLYTRSTEILLKDDSSQSITGDLSAFGVNPVPSDILNEMFIMTSPEILEQVVNQLGLNNVYIYRKGLRSQELYNTSPVIVEPVDSLVSQNASYQFEMELKADSTGVDLSDFIVKGEKLDYEVSAKFNTPVSTPAGTFIFAPTATFNSVLPGTDDKAPSTIKFSHIPAALSARQYSKMLQAEYAEDRGYVIELTISCTSAKKADDVLRAIVDAYNRRWVSDKNQTAQATSIFIDERLNAIEDELGDVESNITDYKSAHRLLDMDAVASIYLSQSAENQQQLNRLTQEIAIGRLLKRELSKNDITRLLPTIAEIGGTNIQQMVTDYNRMVAERNLKLQSMPAESPLIVQKTEAIERSREAILASIDAALESLESRYKAIRLVDDKNQSQLATAPGQAKYLMSEERKQKVKESLYVFLLQRREENELSQAFTVYNTRLITAPYGPDEPTSPNVRLVLLVALVLGVIIPTLIIYIKEVTNTKVRSRHDIESLPLPFLGEVPLADHSGRSHLTLPGMKIKHSDAMRIIMVRPHGRDIINEAFRMIRTNIDFMGAMGGSDNTEGSKVISIVSLNSGSGKTFVSLNTAATFAAKGKKTCLIDFDFRKGTTSINAGSPRVGVTDYLIGKATDVDSLIVRNIDGIEGFDILPRGICPPNPTELLYSANLKKLVEELKTRYDYVLFDCPPIEILADARMLNPYVNLTIFVMRSGLFERSDLSVLRQFYESHRYHNLAVVLNGTDAVHGVYGSYGYGYGYGNTNHRSRNRK